MKISIQHEDITSYIEFEDCDIFEFAERLRGLLHTVWLPEQVNEMMHTEESLSDEFAKVRKEAYDEGYKNGYDDCRAAYKKLAQTTDDLRDCIREGKDNAEKSNILCKQDSSNIL